MKTMPLPTSLIRYATLLFTIQVFLVQLAFTQSEKHALIVAIGNYPAETGWPQINSGNDAVVISDALQRKGFPAANIALLAEEKATRANILGAIRTQLLNRVQAGDIAYFQFSGHGQQVADDNGDEVDGFDEAIVPFNSPIRYEAGVYQGENLIRDDELGALFTEIRRKLGPGGNLMVVIDACHSGTGTRGLEKARGTDIVMAAPDFKPGRSKSDFSFQQSETGVGRKLAPMAAFFGAAQNQLNFETRDEDGRPVGSLSYALSKKLSQSGPTTTYRGLFDQIKMEMSAIAPRQQPQAEGVLDQELMGGRLLETPSHYRVLKWNDQGSVVIDAGWMQGVNEGSMIGLFNAETRNPNDVIPAIQGKVTAARPFECTISLEGEIDQADAMSKWAYVTAQNFGDIRTTVGLKLPAGHPVIAEFEQKIAAYQPVIQFSRQAEVFLLPTPDGGVQLVSSNDFVLETVGANLPPDQAAERLIRRILSFTQAKFLRQLQVNGSTLKVSLEIVPVLVDLRTYQETGRLTLDQKRDAQGNVHFQNNDCFKIKITNRGDQAAYYTVLDIQPDNVININIPDANETPAEYRVGAGQTVEVPKIFIIGPPGGTEMYKLIATDQPVDLRPIAQTRGNTPPRNTSNPLEQLFAQTYSNKDCVTRGGKTISLAAGSIQVFSTTFIID